MGDLHKAVGHYKGLAAGAKRMKDMGHTTASGGGGKPPKKSCRFFALALLAGGGASLTMMAIMIEIAANRLL
jgi:hypothetical protein